MPNIDALSRNLMLDSLKQFAKRKLPFDLSREFDKKNECPVDIIREMFKPDVLGINLLLIQKEYGGLGGGSCDIYRICEALGRIDLGVATTVFATFLGSEPIQLGGTPEQKEKWMSRIAKEGLIVAYCATEADAGSDLMNLKTRAEHVMEHGKLVGYKITGSKQWISNGGIADLCTILALAPEGPSWFLVEKGQKGFSANKHEDKHGIRLSNTCALALDEVIVPVENLISGVEGQGLTQAQAVFGYTRLMVGSLALGAGCEALETAIRYARQRIQAGGPLSEKQGYMLKLIVPHAVKLEASRAYIEEVAKRLDESDDDLQTEGAIAKYFATEAGNDTAEDAIQALGGYGYTKDFSPEKIKRDIKITCIYEGTSEIMEITIFRARWQEHLKSRGMFYINIAKEMEKIHQSNSNIGADSMALCVRGLAKILEACRAQKLTRAQYVTFKLGELIAKSEAACALIKAANKDRYFDGVRFDKETYEAMARVSARETAFDVVTKGIKLVIGAGTYDAESLTAETELIKIQDKQRQINKDMDLIGAKLCELFHS